MSGKMLLVTAVLLCSAVGWTAEKKTPAATANLPKVQYKDSGEVAKLRMQKRDLLIKKQQRRIALLKHDPKLKKMHQQLLQQAMLLAQELESRREMVEFNESIKKIDAQIKSLTK